MGEGSPHGAPERLKMLEWRCRRGMKELDIMLLRYLRAAQPPASDEHAAFAEFLELPDPDLVRYLLAGDIPNDPRQAAICRAILRASRTPSVYHAN